MGDDLVEIEKLKTLLAKEFETKDLGNLRYFLGMEVARSREGIVINQRKYIIDLLSEIGMTNCKLSETPMEVNLKLSKDGTCIVSQYMNDPREEYLEAVNRIFRYLKMTPGHGLIFRKHEDRTIKSFSDSSCVRELTDRRSITGYCSFVWGNLVTWRSKKQSAVSRSIAEVEYRAIALGMCEGIWQQRLLTELDMCDNNYFEL
ncbi:uncharacterized mitochondrial protein AtMg00810-like [Hibiscus syriacus]|uniref:uncharacterized mitochondrial protein AtMg00810-like n=1 Tax=Hibiscus syriacus TaxID=106335 RepID=UPI001920B1B8|nr:uncharacterized mitochondrial protein AtMg00810-like [Hibiscus syriacus]